VETNRKVSEFELFLVKRRDVDVPLLQLPSDAFMAQNHHKLWKDINYDLDIGPVVQLLGE
jgi:hypothetical protein